MNQLTYSFSISYLIFLFSSFKKKKDCRLEQDFKGGYKAKIKISPHDEWKSMVYKFSLLAKRTKIGVQDILNQDFEMELLEVLTPPPVEHINVIYDSNSTSNGVFVILSLPKDLVKISKHLKYNVMLKAQDESELEWKNFFFNDLKQENGDVFVRFEDLKYAYTYYHFKVRIKTKTSADVEMMWSKYQDYFFRTNPKLPVITPKICHNCFNVMANGNIFIYWMEVSKFYWNGKNFQYELLIKNTKGMEVNRIRQHKTSLMIPKSHNDSYIIDIYTVNHLGISLNFSTIHVSKMMSERIVKIKKELFNDFGYKLAWKLRDETKYKVESFTLIWCKQKLELPNQCDDAISFTYLPPHQMEYFMNTSYSTQFGVAVNLENDTVPLGFEWAECTASKPDGII